MENNLLSVTPNEDAQNFTFINPLATCAPTSETTFGAQNWNVVAYKTTADGSSSNAGSFTNLPNNSAVLLLAASSYDVANNKAYSTQNQWTTEATSYTYRMSSTVDSIRQSFLPIPLLQNLVLLRSSLPDTVNGWRRYSPSRYYAQNGTISGNFPFWIPSTTEIQNIASNIRTYPNTYHTRTWNTATVTTGPIPYTVFENGNISNQEARSTGVYAVRPAFYFDLGNNSIFSICGQNIDPANVQYDANGATSGTVPARSWANDFSPTSNITLATNSGNLQKTGYNFGGWQTSAALDNGEGYCPATSYIAGSTYSFPYHQTTKLYACWLFNHTHLEAVVGDSLISVDDDQARIPGGSCLDVRQIEQNSEEFTNFNDEILEKNLQKLYDIKIVNCVSRDVEYDPDHPLKVSISNVLLPDVSIPFTAYHRHFTDHDLTKPESVEEIAVYDRDEDDPTQLVFETDRFSLFGVAYDLPTCANGATDYPACDQFPPCVNCALNPPAYDDLSSTTPSASASGELVIADTGVDVDVLEFMLFCALLGGSGIVVTKRKQLG